MTIGMQSVADPAANTLPARAVGKILVVDDEPPQCRVLGNLLGRAGYQVTCASNGVEAAGLLERERFDAILSDVAMPGLDGIGLLRTVRERDLDVPVLLMTGEGTVDSAAAAVEYGAAVYLLKPLDSGRLLSALHRAVRAHEVALTAREAALALDKPGVRVADRAGLEAAFERALGGLWIAYQPILRVLDRGLFGYEALLRSNEPALPHPGAVLEAAERLNRVHDIGHVVRARVAREFAATPGITCLFVNLHARDLLDERLTAPDAPLTAIASRVVLEITERASSTDIKDLRLRIDRLRRMGFKIAIDDLGAGYSGLASVVSLEPDVIKLDMSLVRGVDESSMKQKLVRALAELCRRLGILLVGEGVETPGERDMLVELGCTLLQGYLHGKPAQPFADVRWESTDG
jgi:EAL domain-containing protein (putative c-di-GMP-specific phosphodiesterase class I)